MSVLFGEEDLPFLFGEGGNAFLLFIQPFFTWGKEIFYLGRRDERVFGAVVSVSL